jgi:hypothetical protein
MTPEEFATALELLDEARGVIDRYRDRWPRMPVSVTQRDLVDLVARIDALEGGEP